VGAYFLVQLRQHIAVSSRAHKGDKGEEEVQQTAAPQEEEEV
jgi:hypothetical protein